MEDKTLTCADCGQPFTFSAGEQEFYQQRGMSEPKRCKPCREARKAERGGGRGGRRSGGGRDQGGSYNRWEISAVENGREPGLMLEALLSGGGYEGAEGKGDCQHA